MDYTSGQVGRAIDRVFCARGALREPKVPKKPK
jgi:hypothetical protein